MYMYIHKYMYVFMYTCMTLYVCMYVCMYVCVYTYINTCIGLHTYVYMYMHAYTYMITYLERLSHNVFYRRLRKHCVSSTGPRQSIGQCWATPSSTYEEKCYVHSTVQRGSLTCTSCSSF